MVKAIEGYQPQRKQQNILNCAMVHIQSVPYQVTLRWLFYRLLQDGLYHDKKDYKDFIRLQSVARKSFYDGWRPDTLADATREVIIQGDGWSSAAEWIRAIGEAEYREVIWHSQKYYIEVWFEAAAMIAQFRHYVDDIPLFSFHGECSIAPKWAAAKRLEYAFEQYQLPIVVLYFGDDDPKGQEIPENAIKDVKAWSKVPFEFVRGGLNSGDGGRLGLSENIDKPGAYQWEALDDIQAGQLITDTVSQYFDVGAADELHHSAKTVTEDYQQRISRFIEDWQ